MQLQINVVCTDVTLGVISLPTYKLQKISPISPRLMAISLFGKFDILQ